MSTILDALKEHVTPELLAEAANRYGETEVNISKAIGGFAPAILAGILEKSGDSHSIEHVFNLIRNFDPRVLDQSSGLLDEAKMAQIDPQNASSQLLSAIFGAKIPAITNAVAAFAGVKPATASALIQSTCPQVMGLLSKKIQADKLNPFSLVSYLLSQKPAFMSVMPAGLNAMLGMVNTGTGSFGESESGGNMGWVLPVILIVGILAAIIFGVQNC